MAIIRVSHSTWRVLRSAGLITLGFLVVLVAALFPRFFVSNGKGIGGQPVIHGHDVLHADAPPSCGGCGGGGGGDGGGNCASGGGGGGTGTGSGFRGDGGGDSCGGPDGSGCGTSDGCGGCGGCGACF